MKQITLSVPNNQFSFFMKMVKAFDFVKVEKTKAISDEPALSVKGTRILSGTEESVKEVNLHKAKTKRANRGDHVEVGELHWVVGVTARHAGKPQEVHWEEGHIKENQRAPKMNFAARFVVHHAGPLG